MSLLGSSSGALQNVQDDIEDVRVSRGRDEHPDVGAPLEAQPRDGATGPREGSGGEGVGEVGQSGESEALLVRQVHKLHQELRAHPGAEVPAYDARVPRVQRRQPRRVRGPEEVRRRDKAAGHGRRGQPDAGAAAADAHDAAGSAEALAAVPAHGPAVHELRHLSPGPVLPALPADVALLDAAAEARVHAVRTQVATQAQQAAVQVHAGRAEGHRGRGAQD